VLSATLACGHRRMDQLAAAVHPEMGLHPEIPLVTLFRLMHLGSRVLSAFLVDDGALRIVASTIVSVATFSPFAAKCCCIASNNRRPRSCASIEPFYPKPGNGRPPVGIERMLCIYFMKQWFNPSDPAVEEAL
jgi:hypothetical protein